VKPGHSLPRVVLADDHAMLLEAFRCLLEPRCEIVGCAANGRELLAMVQQLRPDIAVLDISMPGLNGIDAGEQLLRLHPDVRLIYLTVNEDTQVAAEMIRRGAAGFLLKSSATKELFDAIEQAMAGTPYVTPLLTGGMPLKAFMSENQRGNNSSLTPRQREVVQLLAEGLAMKEVADRLDITPRTVAFHKYTVMNAFGLRTSADLMRFAFENHLVTKKS